MLRWGPHGQVGTFMLLVSAASVIASTAFAKTKKHVENVDV